MFVDLTIANVSFASHDSNEAKHDPGAAVGATGDSSQVATPSAGLLLAFTCS